MKNDKHQYISNLYDSVKSAVFHLRTGFYSPHQSIISINNTQDIFESHGVYLGVIFCEMHILRIRSIVARSTNDYHTLSELRKEIVALIDYAIEENFYFERLTLTRALILRDFAKGHTFEGQEWISALYEAKAVLKSLIESSPKYENAQQLLLKIRKDISNINPI